MFASATTRRRHLMALMFVATAAVGRASAQQEWNSQFTGSTGHVRADGWRGWSSLHPQSEPPSSRRQSARTNGRVWVGLNPQSEPPGTGMRGWVSLNLQSEPPGMRRIIVNNGPGRVAVNPLMWTTGNNMKNMYESQTGMMRKLR